MNDTVLEAARRAFERGNLAEAGQLYGRVLQSAPQHFESVSRIGLIQLASGDFKSAEATLAAAIAIDGQSADLHFHHGRALQSLQRHEEAIVSFRRAATIKPDYIEALNNWGTALLTLGRSAEALACFDRVLALRQDLAIVHNNRAAALLGLRRYEDCSRAAERALQLEPDNVKAMVNRGAASFELGRYAEAIEWGESVLARDPKQLTALHNLGNAYWGLSRYSEAFTYFDRAYALDADRPYLESWRLHAKLHLCDWSSFESEISELVRHLDEGKPVEPFLLLLIENSPQRQLACAKRYAAERFRTPTPFSREEPVEPHEKLRIGYVSGEFRAQPTAYLTAELFECHDRRDFEIVGFSTGPNDGSVIRQRLEHGFDRFFDVAKSSDAEICEAVRKAGVDVLVDLNGYFGVRRTQVFASRPAPVQVNYLGFPGTMGAPFIDYIIADRTIIPESEQKYYSERVAYLPHCYQPNDRKRTISGRAFSRAECGLPEEGFIFVCFNANQKLNPGMFDIWMRLLQEVQGSVLWLLQGSTAVRQNLEREAMARRIEPGRLVFAPFMELPDHLARLKTADLFLDTLPHNAHTTASDALWSGVPVLTATGSTFAGRVATSLVRAAGIPALAVSSLSDYERTALELARNPGLLAKIKQKLARNRGNSPLFDTPRFARGLEAAYKLMWDRHERGLSPTAITVSEDG